MRILKIVSIVLGIQIMAIAGCGSGGGGGGGGQTAIVKLATSGVLPGGRTITGISTTLNYPTAKGLSISSGNVVASGVGTGSLVAPNTNNAGQVGIVLGTGTGIQTGEFVTLTFSIALGDPQVVAGDFSIAPGSTSIIDINGAIPGITVVVQSVTIQ